ncbi:MAG: hypothetical protein RR475_02485 [Clostridia bacterium]
MEEYKPNSYKSKEEQKTSDKKIEKVVSGTTKTKKNEARKWKDVFISEDVGNVKSYVLMEVLVPALKKAISDIVTNGIDMILYGEPGRTKKSSPGSKVSYRSYYESRNDREYSDRCKARTGFDYDDIIFETRGDAEAVLSSMNDIIDVYRVVSVGDLYDLADVSTTNYTVNRYGWTDLSSADVTRTREGDYVLKLPRALPIN